ncbi:alpha-tectorin-like [Discoglossus pictus]
MDLRSLLFVLLISASACFIQLPPPSTTEQICPLNSHSVEGKVCAPSCDTANEIDLVCNVMEESGCICNDGYIIQSNNSATCIPSSECKVSCPPNMHYDTKASGCQEQCIDMMISILCPVKIRPQCVCDHGYILSENECITVQSCKEKLKNKSIILQS